MPGGKLALILFIQNMVKYNSDQKKQEERQTYPPTDGAEEENRPQEGEGQGSELSDHEDNRPDEADGDKSHIEEEMEETPGEGEYFALDSNNETGLVHVEDDVNRPKPQSSKSTQQPKKLKKPVPSKKRKRSPSPSASESSDSESDSSGSSSSSSEESDSSSDSDSDSSSSEEESKKKKKKSKKPAKSKKKKKKAKKAKKPNLRIVTKAEKNAWKVKGERKLIWNHHSRVRTRAIDLKEKINDVYPVPQDLYPIPMLDSKVEQVLKLRNKHIAVTKADSLYKAQEKVRDSLGPLYKGWKKAKSKKTKKMLGLTVLMLGQTITRLSHQRRLIVLTEQFDFKRAKELTAAGEKFFQEEKEWLFGDDFKENLHRQDRDALFEGRAPLLKPFSGGPSGKGAQQSQRNNNHRDRNGGHRNRDNNGNSNRGNGQNKSNQRGKTSSSIDNGAPRGPRDSEPVSASVSVRKPKKCHKGLTQRVSSGRKITSFSRELESHHKRQVHTGHNRKWSKYSINEPLYGKYRGTSLGPGRGRKNRGRDSKNARKTRNKRGDRNRKKGSGESVFKSVCEEKARRVFEADRKPPKNKQAHPIPSLQDGGDTQSKRSPDSQRLSHQNRYERRVLLGATKCKVQKIGVIQVGEQSVRVPGYVLRARMRPTHLYQIDQSTHLHPEEGGRTAGDLSGRHPFDGPDFGGDPKGKGSNLVPTGEPRLHNKPSEVNLDSAKEYGLFGIDNRHTFFNNPSPRRKSDRLGSKMQRHDRDQIVVSSERGQTGREANSHKAGGQSSINACETASDVSEKITSKVEFVRVGADS